MPIGEPEHDLEPDPLRERLAAVVRRVCRGRLAPLADDIVQQAWIRIREQRVAPEGSAEPPASYLWKVAYSVTIDEIRKARRRREEPIEERTAETAGGLDELDPERRLAGREAGRAIRDCLEGLIAPRRRAVGLYLLGHGVQEVSRLLKEDYKRMENLVLRGLADLRACLQAKGVSW